MFGKRSRKPTTLQIGSISEGTLRPEDLIDRYLDELERIVLSRKERGRVRSIRASYDAAIGNTRSEYWNDIASEDLQELSEMMENHCPDYSYFGTSEGDGASFGIWPSIDSLEDDAIEHSRYLDPRDPRSRYASVLKMAAGDEFPSARKATVSHIMEVSDHGNVTLYRRSGNRWIEVWAVV